MSRGLFAALATVAFASQFVESLAGAGGVRGGTQTAWDYRGFQRGDWPEKGYPLCAGEPAGPEYPHNEWQAPVDIPDEAHDVENETLTLVAVDGGCREVGLERDGHTWEASFQMAGCTNLVARWRGRNYTMLQLHFHIESENMLAGHHKDMEVHMVHQSEDGHVLVIAQFLHRHAAVAEQNAFLDELLTMGFMSDNITAGLLMNPYVGTMKANDQFYSYLGSLTTPPCTPNLEWVVMTEPIQVAPEDIAKFEAYMKTTAASQADSYGRDDRPVQPLNGRPVKLGRIGAIA